MGGIFSLCARTGCSDCLRRNVISLEVDMYDASTGKWSQQKLSVARSAMAGGSCGNRLFFGGGVDGTWTDYYNIVDVFKAR